MCAHGRNAAVSHHADSNCPRKFEMPVHETQLSHIIASTRLRFLQVFPSERPALRPRNSIWPMRTAGVVPHVHTSPLDQCFLDFLPVLAHVAPGLDHLWSCCNKFECTVFAGLVQFGDVPIQGLDLVFHPLHPARLQLSRDRARLADLENPICCDPTFACMRAASVWTPNSVVGCLASGMVEGGEPGSTIVEGGY